MQLQTYFRILMRRGWIMILLAVITAAAAFGFSNIMEQKAPIYKSTVKILIQPARSDYGQAQAAKDLLRSYVAWMDSNYRSAEVIEALELDMLPADLRSDVTFASDASQLVIQIDVENPNGDLANDIAYKWANLLLDWRNERNATVLREDRIDAFILDDPIYVLDSPKTRVNTAAGAVLGFLVGLAIVLVLEYLESGVIRTAEDVNRFLDIQVLGAIPPAES